MAAPHIIYRIDPFPGNADLNILANAAWDKDRPYQQQDFQPILERSLVHICAYSEGDLIGYINVATDGGKHAFLLDTMVHPDFRRYRIGTELVKRAITEARKRGAHWLHVDFEPHLEPFYLSCGFAPTQAGLIRIQ